MIKSRSECNHLIGDVIVDVGPLYQRFIDRIIETESNHFVSLKNNMSNRYNLDWEFTERQKNLFNEGEIADLYISFAGGQAFINIKRDGRNLRLFVEYYDAEKGADLSESRKPVGAKVDDF